MEAASIERLKAGERSLSAALKTAGVDYDDPFDVACRIIERQRPAAAASPEPSAASPSRGTLGATAAAAPTPLDFPAQPPSLAERWGFTLPSFTQSQVIWVTLALALMVFGLAVSVDNFFNYRNLFNISRNFSYVGIIALGQMMVIITAGIDLSVGSIMALAAVVTAKVLSAGAPLFVGLSAGLLAAAAAGFVNGFLIVRFKLQPFVVTLGMLTIARSLVLVMTKGRTINSFGPDEDLYLFLGGGTSFGISHPLLALLVLMVAVGFMLRLTTWGRHVYAIGGNEEAARLTGVPVHIVKLSVYVLSSLLAGVSGIMMAGWLASASANLGVGFELRVIASAVIGGANLMGGAGGAFGALVGAAVLEVTRNGLLLMGMDPFLQGTFVGLFIIGAVMVERVRHEASRYRIAT